MSYIREGVLSEEFLRLRFGGLIFERAYFYLFIYYYYYFFFFGGGGGGGGIIGILRYVSG